MYKLTMQSTKSVSEFIKLHVNAMQLDIQLANNL